MSVLRFLSIFSWSELWRRISKAAECWHEVPFCGTGFFLFLFLFLLLLLHFVIFPLTFSLLFFWLFLLFVILMPYGS